jgi:hypothetical protein
LGKRVIDLSVDEPAAILAVQESQKLSIICTHP